MQKNTMVIIGVIIVAVLAVGSGVLLTRKSSPAASTTNTSATKSTASAVNNAVLQTKTDASLGQYLADPNGKPLYTYGADTTGVSNCTGSCLANWPAYVATSSTVSLPAGVGTLARTDNKQVQYTYNGMPLYYFVGDSNGSVTGDGVENFHIAKPAAAPTSTTAPSNSSSNPSPSSTNSSPYPY